MLYLEAHPSFAALEAAQNAFDGAIASNAALKAEFDAVQRHGDMHSSQRTAIYRYRARPQLSARARWRTWRGPAT